MSTTASPRGYTPQQGSTAWKVIEFLTTNADEALSTGDVEAKFGKPRSQVHSILAAAVDAGVLIRYEDLGEGELHYKLGTGCPAIEPNAGRHPTLGPALTGEGQKVASSQKRRRPPTVIDAAAIPLDDGVPLPAISTGRRPTDWPALFGRMKPGQSVQLPKAVKATLGKAISLYHREHHDAELATRVIDDEHLRLWRVT